MESPSQQTVYKDSLGFTFHWKYESKEMSLVIGYDSQHEDLDSKILSGQKKSILRTWTCAETMTQMLSISFRVLFVWLYL